MADEKVLSKDELKAKINELREELKVLETSMEIDFAKMLNDTASSCSRVRIGLKLVETKTRETRRLVLLFKKVLEAERKAAKAAKKAG